MLKPFYQGKLDAFCAVYAVLNGLRITHGLRSAKAREILNGVLLNLSLKPAAFHAFLNQKTDYMALVDEILEAQSKRFRLHIEKPFQQDERISSEDFWNVCKEWVGENGVERQRAMIFRFLRFSILGQPPLNRHWTTSAHVESGVLRLFDSSHEAESIQNVRRDAFVTDIDAVSKERLLLIPPSFVRFICLGN